MASELVVSRLAILQAQIAGIRRAYSEPPETISVMDMPLFINLVGPGSHDLATIGENYDLETRLYRMRLFIRPSVTGFPGEGETEARPFIRAVTSFFQGRPSLGGGALAGLDEVQESAVIADSGVMQALMFGGTAHIGIEFTLQVKEYVFYDYAPNE